MLIKLNASIILEVDISNCLILACFLLELHKKLCENYLQNLDKESVSYTSNLSSLNSLLAEISEAYLALNFEAFGIVLSESFANDFLAIDLFIDNNDIRL